MAGKSSGQVAQGRLGEEAHGNWATSLMLGVLSDGAKSAESRGLGTFDELGLLPSTEGFPMFLLVFSLPRETGRFAPLRLT